MSNNQTKVTPKEPELKAWDCQAEGLPRALVKAYGRFQAASEYRHIYNLHESRKVDTKELV